MQFENLTTVLFSLLVRFIRWSNWRQGVLYIVGALF